jgi:hypothetical protein
MSKRASPRSFLLFLGVLAVPAVVIGACGSSNTSGSNGSASTQSGSGGAGSGHGGATTASSSASGIVIAGAGGGGPDGGPCEPTCAINDQSIVDCNGKVIGACPAGQGCDLTTLSCTDACTAAKDNQQSVGCDYYATRMDMDYSDQCFAAFIANTWSTPVHISVEFYPNTPLTVSQFAFIPSGTGSTITYAPYDDTAGLPPGQVAILFLGGTPTSSVPCPSVVTKTAIPNGSLVQGTGTGQSFHITTDVPVVAYQINPYGGGNAAITGASLLLPTSVWDVNYVAVTAAPYSAVTMDPPSINIVSMTDNTQVTILPNVAIVGGGTLKAGPANTPYVFTLNQGEQAQFAQQADLSGSIVQASNPVGVMAGNACMQEPLGTSYCDHGEQMIPPVKALGSEYVAVMFRPRVPGDQAFWRLVGALDGTTLTYSPATPAGAPTTLSAGQIVEFNTDVPFVVSSQDNMHPFMFFTLMSGSLWSGLSEPTGYGDPDFVLNVPARQYLNNYIFFTDVTYPETNLVLIRAKNKSGNFDDVTLDCVTGPLTGWTAVGEYEWTRVDLMRHNFEPQGACSNGRHQVSSPGLFGLWVWGWGSPETQNGTCDGTAANFTCYVSYGYPGGMNVQSINPVIIPPVAQ